MSGFPSTPRQRKHGQAGLMAKKFLRRALAGKMIDRSHKQRKNGKQRKMMPVPNSLLKFLRPRPLATESLEG